MTHDTTNTTDASLSECGHERFERNHYFHGKLMTARDMAAEQAYHAGQRWAHARSVAGSGVAWGMDASVSSDGDDAIVVTVGEGYAIDECGRPVVVPHDREKTVQRSDIDFDGTSAVTVSLTYEACLKESVPVAGAESACEDECAYNRVLEAFEIDVTGGTPAEMAKPVSMVEFPDRDQFDTVDDSEAPEPTDDGLATIASSYREEADHVTADPDTTEVFVGVFEESEGTWSRVEEFPTSFVYTNDMLYAAIARHTADFGNPHDVLTSVDGVQHVDGDVELVSDDGTIESGPSGTGGAAVSLELADAVKSEIDDLSEYVRDKTLKYTIEAFYDVAATYAGVDGDLAVEINAIAVEIIRRARDALDDEDFKDEHEFAVAIRDLGAHQEEIGRRLADSRDDDALTDLATDRSYDDYERAVDALAGLLPSDPDGTIAGAVPDGYVDENSVTALAVSQDQLCEAATWLETSTHGRMTLPGGHEVESRIIQDVIDPRVVEPAGLGPGDPVVDREADTPQTAIVLREAEENADEWIVYQDETVAHQNRMYDYADDEPVVLVAYEEILDENWEYWRAADPRDLFHGVLSRSIKFHAFPEARLRRVEE